MGKFKMPAKEVMAAAAAGQAKQAATAVGGTGRTAPVLAVDQITERNADTRPADPRHVLDLCESIAAVGLIEPIVVDRRGRLVAGLHRYQACRILLMDAGDRLAAWTVLADAVGYAVTDADEARLASLPIDLSNVLADGLVPIHRQDYDAMKDPAAALATEIAENEKRRDYTKKEVQALKDRMEAAGYDFSGGRPKKGIKAGIPAIQTIIGKSRRQVHRLIGDQQTAPSGTVSPEESLCRSLRRYLRDVPKSPHADNVNSLLSRLGGGNDGH